MASKIEALREALRRLLAQHKTDGTLPTSARFLYYELVAAGIISKHALGPVKSGCKGQRQPHQDVGVALTNLRESGEVPWAWISDETRSLDDFTGWSSVADGLDAYVNVIRLDPWSGDAPLILTESRSLAGVLRDLAREYGVRISATNGQAGGFLHTDVAQHLTDGSRVLYLGDHDLAGASIEANTRRVLERALDCALDWERLALTKQQVNDYALPSVAKSDSRFKRGGGAHQAVETEALSQKLIVQIVRDRLDILLPQPLAKLKAQEDVERAHCRALLNGGASSS